MASDRVMPCFEAQASLFGDLIGKLGVLRIECAKWGRSGPVPPPENAQRRAETAMTRRR